MSKPNFREPVFVRNDDTTEIAASVVEWNDAEGGVSIRLRNGSESVLVNSRDWDALKSCVDRELERVQ